MNLIDKDALVAKIDNLKHKIDDCYSYSNGWKDALLMVEAELNTLEVKKVDLDEEIEKCLKQHSMLAVGKKDFTDIAKYFFELGLKVAQNNS